MALVGTASITAAVKTKDIRARLYFLSEAVGTVILESLLLMHLPYVAPYLALRAVSLSLAIWVAEPYIQHWLLGFGLAFATVLSLKSLDPYASTAMLQGLTYVTAGSASVKRFPALALTWLCLGLFNFGFAEGWQLPVWANLNQWALAGIATIGFLLFSVQRKRVTA